MTVLAHVWPFTTVTRYSGYYNATGHLQYAEIYYFFPGVLRCVKGRIFSKLQRHDKVKHTLRVRIWPSGLTQYSLHNMEAADFFKILVPFHQTTHYLIPKGTECC